jgi:hypothetical protein
MKRIVGMKCLAMTVALVLIAGRLLRSIKEI